MKTKPDQKTAADSDLSESSGSVKFGSGGDAVEFKWDDGLVEVYNPDRELQDRHYIDIEEAKQLRDWLGDLISQNTKN